MNRIDKETVEGKRQILVVKVNRPMDEAMASVIRTVVTKGIKDGFMILPQEIDVYNVTYEGDRSVIAEGK